jgi:hypothetical protein
MRLNPVAMLVRELLEQIERALDHELIIIFRECSQLSDERRIVLDDSSYLFRVGNAPTVAAGEQATDIGCFGHRNRCETEGDAR